MLSSIGIRFVAERVGMGVCLCYGWLRKEEVGLRVYECDRGLRRGEGLLPFVEGGLLERQG